MITQFFKDYDKAKAYARELVKEYNRDAGIRRTHRLPLSGYLVSFLSAPEHTYGDDMRAERVRAGD